MAEFVKVATISEIPDPGRKVVNVEDRMIVILRVGDDYFAIDDVCTHDDGPLSEGELEEYAIACPRHGAKFDIRNGKVLSMPATRPTVSHQVKVAGEEILVRLSE